MLPSIHTCISIRADYIQNAIKYTHAAILDTYILACTQRLTHVHAYIYTSMDETIHTYVHTYRPTYVHTHMHTHIRTYVRTYVQTRTRTHAHTHTHTHTHTLSLSYIYIYVYTYIYICIHMRTYKHTYKDTSVRTYTRTHEYAYIRTCKIDGDLRVVGEFLTQAGQGSLLVGPASLGPLNNQALMETSEILHPNPNLTPKHKTQKPFRSCLSHGRSRAMQSSLYRSLVIVILAQGVMLGFMPHSSLPDP